MKKINLLFVFFLLVSQLIAQTAITVHGTVTNIANGTPVVNYPVTIQTDSVNGFYYTHTVFTNPNGFYTDQVPVFQPNTPGIIHVSTYDCQQYLISYTLTYIPSTTLLEQNFVICASPQNCDANFTYETTGPMSKHFHDISANSTTYRMWYFGDGATSTNVDPNHTFPAPGLYPVKLIIGAPGLSCWDSIIQQVQVGDTIPTGCQAYFHTEPDNQVPNLIHFINQSTGTNLSTYLWDFGDGTTATTGPANPGIGHEYATTGTFYPCLTVIASGNTCTDTYCSQVTVGSTGGCIANYSFSTSGNVAPVTVQFTDLSSATSTIVSWLWNFNDPTAGVNNTSSLQNPVHVFAAPGVFSVCLTITTSSGCTSTYCHPVEIGQPQNCEANYTYEFTGTLTVHFHDISTGQNSQRLWDFGDGTASTNVDPYHTFASPGLYPVKLTIGIPGTTCSDSITQMILVGDTIPTGCQAYYHAENDPQIPYLVHFINQSQGNIGNYLWDFGDGTTTPVTFPANPNVDHQYAAAGTYLACLTIIALDSTCTDTYCEEIQVEGNSGQCQAYFTWEAVPSSSYTIQFTNQSTASTTIMHYQWQFGDGTGSDMQNPTHTYSAPGVYTTCLTITADGGCTSTFCKPVQVGNNQQCHAEFNAHETMNNPMTWEFIDHSEGNINSWTWEFGDGQTVTVIHPNNPNVAHTYALPGYYTACLTIRGIDSLCYSTYCETIAVGDTIPQCQAQFTYYPDSTNSGNNFHFVDLSSGSPTSWHWEFGDPQSGASNVSNLQNPNHSFSEPGTYYVCLTIHGPNCESTWCSEVEIEQTPSCINYFTYSTIGLSAHFEGHLLNATPASYVWDFGDNQSGIGENQVHNYSAPGVYYVTLTTTTQNPSNPCTYTSSQMITVGDSTLWHQLYGQVFAGNFPVTQGLVMLFSVDTSNYFVPFVDITTLDSQGVYVFPMVPQGNFYVYAIPFMNGYLPTYYGDVLNWSAATVISLGTPANPYNIHLVEGDSYTPGTGTIQGQVNQGDISQGLVDKITMLLKDENGKTISYAQVNNTGEFIFPQLAFGTYYLYAELAGCQSQTIRVVIDATNTAPQVILQLSGNRILGTSESIAELIAGVVYPNPVNDIARITIKPTNPTDLTVELSNTAGQVVYQKLESNVHGETLLSILVAPLTPGIYTLRLYSHEGLMITRKLVK
ncbi:MAG: PKD domain-containing protein [Bacteroidetes bacterium]|nr:PKD domain-containing protein [Bacteroidota bacterium]